jgi:uncharacterized membrane protein YphA (DoxX/SURF4 family)
MKIAVTVCRLLLGLVFLIFGLNGFLHFIPNMSMPAGALAFVTALANTGYMLALLFAAQVVAGVLLLSGFFVPFALAILAPIIINIFFFHIFLAPDGIPLAIVVTALELFLVWANWEAFAPMLEAA